MRKIKSRVDVITNSSTEVFTLKTNKSLKEVSDFLKAHTSGYLEPEVMKKGEGVLEELKEFGYLYDPEDEDNMAEFYINSLGVTAWMDEDWNEHEYPGAKEIQQAWKDFLWARKDQIQDYWDKEGMGHLNIKELRYDCFSAWYLPEPKKLIDEFLKSYKGIKPETLTLKDIHNVNSYVGKIGFMGVDENSIPYEDWDLINEEFDGTNWHMG